MSFRRHSKYSDAVGRYVDDIDLPGCEHFVLVGRWRSSQTFADFKTHDWRAFTSSETIIASLLAIISRWLFRPGSAWFRFSRTRGLRPRPSSARQRLVRTTAVVAFVNG